MTDDSSRGGANTGADIDAVGAISTRPVVVDMPELSTIVLLLLGILGLAIQGRRI